jgi:ribosomal protein L13E
VNGSICFAEFNSIMMNIPSNDCDFRVIMTHADEHTFRAFGGISLGSLMVEEMQGMGISRFRVETARPCGVHVHHYRAKENPRALDTPQSHRNRLLTRRDDPIYL